MSEQTQGWLDRRERGSVFFMRLAIFAVTVLGRTFGRILVAFLAFYYTVFSRTTRRVSQDFQRRLGMQPSFWTAYHHVRHFAQVTLDNVFLLAGKTKPFEVIPQGTELIDAVRSSGKGALLVGAHLGSFNAMRMRSHSRKVPVYAVVYQKNAQKLGRVLSELDPDGAKIIEMDPEAGMDFMLKVKEKIEEGALVAMLADRVTNDARSVTANFLDGQARFAAGPFLLASMIKCPVLLAFGVYEEPNRYRLFVEEFAERIELPRKDREGALKQYIEKYAARLEHYARTYPNNWFNFFDFFVK